MRNQSKKLIAMACSLALLVGVFDGSAGMKAGTVQAAENITIEFEGGSIRLPKNYDAENGTPEEKMAAAAKADLRFGYTITLPTGMTMKDVKWFWDWKSTNPAQTRTGVNGVEYVELGNNQYRTNLVITGIPMSQVYATDITADLTVTSKTDANIKAECLGKTRSVKTVAEEIKAKIENNACSESEAIQDYVTCLVGTQMADAGTLFVFENESDLGVHRDTVTFLSKYEGEEGVISLTGGQEYNHVFRELSKNTAFDKEYYQDCDKLVLRVRTDSNFIVALLSETPWIEMPEVTISNTDSWQDIEVDFSTFKNNWDGFTNHLFLLNKNSSSNADGHLYIASIKAVKKVALEDQRSIKGCAIGDVVTLKDNSKDAFTGKNLSCYVSRPDGSNYVVTDGIFIADQTGLYTVSYLAEAVNATEYGSYQIQVSKVEEKDETLWDTDSGVEALGGYNTSAATWLESHEGETGVIRLGHDQWVHIYRGMKPVHEKAYYEGCDTLVFKVKTDDPSGQKTLTYLAEGKNCEINVNVTGNWTEVAVPLTNMQGTGAGSGTLDVFWTNYIDANTSMMWVHDGTAGSHVYIADIKLVKSESN